MPTKVDKARDAMKKFALSLPEAWEDFPWDHTAMKVKKKVFVFMDGKTPDPKVMKFSVKLTESGDVLALPIAEPTGYGLGKSGWVSFTCRAKDVPPVAMLREWIVESYRAIAPKTLVKQLDADS